MAEATRLPRYSLEEYLILEGMSNARHEYLGWATESCGPGSTARLVSVGAELQVEAVYRNPLPD